jgi:antitoxin FitA
MPHILVRGLDEKTITRLKERARASGRSLQQEVKSILERAASTLTMGEVGKLADTWRRRLAGRTYSDSAKLVRDDRDSR